MYRLEPLPKSPNFSIEERLFSEGFEHIAGVDEAGRGPLAGPVVASAVILPRNPLPYLTGVKDSKQMTAPARFNAFKRIKHVAIAWGVGASDNLRIDDIGILEATREAMAKAISKLSPAADYLLLDAMNLQEVKIPQIGLIKGDAISLSISAASVISKVTRDGMMQEADKRWNSYGFAAHKGYGTRAHMEALLMFGPCPIHRYTFRPVREAMRLQQSKPYTDYEDSP